MEKKKEVKFVITQHIADLKKSKKGWSKELNMVSWEGGDPVLDIRWWNPEHSFPRQGATIHEDEAKILKEYL